MNDKLIDLSMRLSNLTKHPIEYIPWTGYLYKPKVQFSIAHSNNNILLKYEVKEKHIRAVNTTINSPVWEDACVEFFIELDEDGYYNFEFNCIGTALVGFGKGRNGRELLTEETIRKIKYRAIINNTKDYSIEWELTVVIPIDVFVYHRLSSLHNKQCRANFYKCGDQLPEPHFVSWANIQSPEPNFHLPEFFGAIEFE